MTKDDTSPKPPADGAKVVRVTGRRCPICNKPAVAEFRPFCSKRCADIDLGRWIDGDYRIATDDEADFDEGFPEDDA